MVFKDGKLLMAYGVMGGDMQAQGHVQVLVNLIERGLNLQQALDAPRVRYISGRGVMMEDGLGGPVIDALVARGHERVLPGPGLTHRALMGGGQAVMLDPVPAPCWAPPMCARTAWRSATSRLAAAAAFRFPAAAV